MQMGAKSILGLAAAGLLVSAGAASAQQWNRNLEWTPGTSPGSSGGNPGPGQGGQAIWGYQAVTGGGALGSASAWYERSRSRLEWDDQWWNTGSSAWATGDDLSPPVMQDRIIHNLHTSTFDAVPMVSWTNPLAGSTQVDVTGSLRLRWTGNDGIGMPVDVDLMLGLYDASLGVTTPLLAHTYAKPTAAPTFEEEVVIPVAFPGLLLDAGDEIVLTHRGRESFGPRGMWVTVFDGGMNITLVPAPGAAAVLGMAGLAAVRRRRTPH